MYYSELTAVQATRLRKAFKDGIGVAVLAKRFDISPNKVKQVIENKVFPDETYKPPSR